MCGTLIERKESVKLDKVRRVKLERQSRKGRLAMTKRDGVTRGTGSHLYTRGQGLYFRSEHSVRFSTTYHPLLQRRRYIVLHRVLQRA